MSVPPGSRFVLLDGPLASFPRRARSFRLRFYDQSDRPIAEFTVPNPAPGPYPTWKPEPLPITKREGNLSFTLTALLTRLEGGNWSDNREVERPTVVPVFRIRENGKPTQVWEEDGDTIVDATGNSISTNDWKAGCCLYEPAWKLRAQFWRTAQASFTPTETWTVRSVSVPKDRALVRLAGSTTLQGVKLQLIALTGAGKADYINGVPGVIGKSAFGRSGGISMSSTSAGAGGVVVNGRQYKGPVDISTIDSGMPCVALRVTGLAVDQRLMLKAVDNRRRQLVSSGSGSSGELRFLQIDIPPDARKADLTFIVQKCRVAEYLVRPPRPWCDPEFRLDQPGHVATALAFSPDGKSLVVAGGSEAKQVTAPGAVTLWDLATRQARAMLEGHRALVDAVAFSPDGGTIVTGSLDHTVRLWDPTGRPQAVLHGHTGPVRGLAFARDGQTFATAGENGRLILWELKSRQQRAVLHNDGGLTCLALSPDGKTLAAGAAGAAGQPGLVKLWDVGAHQLQATLRDQPDEVDALAFSPDGKTLAIGNRAGTVQMWDLATRHLRRPPRWDASTIGPRSYSLGFLLGPMGEVHGLAFSPDGKLLATAEGSYVKLRDPVSGQKLAGPLFLSPDCRCVAFSPDGQLLAAGGTEIVPPPPPSSPPQWPQIGAVKVWRVVDDFARH